MQVAFVHYHVKRGGVTRVMENAMEALSQAYGLFDGVVLCGTKPPEDCVLPVKVVDGIGYAGASEREDPKVLADRMQQAAKEFLGKAPDVWHIHNHSLGKNPGFADTVVELANRGCKILLQIHDFAEDGRPNNYQLRENGLESAGVYPIAESIRYAVLNRRDYTILTDAGIPESHLYWVPNPVLIRELEYDTSGFDSSLDQLILYPVRAVRRKNLGELLFHATLPCKRRSYMTTLGTTSEDFVLEYQQWRDFSFELGLNVNFEVCQSYGMSFDSVVDHSHSIISTSVAEGFGLGFMEPWVFGKTLIGRDLPEITDDFKDMGVQLNRLYKEIPVPVSVFRFDEFRIRTQAVARSYHERYGIDYEKEWFDQWVNTVVVDRHIDFAKLDEIAQREIIESLQGNYDLQQKYLEIFHYEPEEQSVVDSNASIIETELSIKKYGERLKGIYEELIETDAAGSLRFADSANVLNSFFSVDRFLPLRA